MVRVENQGRNVAAWCRETGGGATTYDVCLRHWVSLLRVPRDFADSLPPQGPGEPVGEGGYGGDVAHPPYDDDLYLCAICEKVLTEAEDGEEAM